MPMSNTSVVLPAVCAKFTFDDSSIGRTTVDPIDISPPSR